MNDASAFITGSDFEELDEIIQVYNLEVEDFHSYFVGENSILVHNMYPKQDLPVRDASTSLIMPKFF
ncbi:MAG: HINT domain-containing protein [Oscillospiraceae bacterium]|nr:HINT domain-containing protein [Oscillospiraceae bacterium]